MRKGIDKLPHKYRLPPTVAAWSEQYIEIDIHNSNFKNSIYAKIHTANDGERYIWFKHTTYYL